MQPTYSCEIVGPSHAPRFKSMVTIGSMSFQNEDFFFTLKDAEDDAAKVAYEHLSLNPPHKIEEDVGLYKNLLQELAQKSVLRLPTYKTEKSGPPHLPVFISNVEVGGENFQGQKAKSKKLAEMSAAKTAYIYLTESQEKLSSRVGGTPKVLSLNLQPNVMEKVEEDIANKINISDEEAEEIKVTNGERTRNSTTFEDTHAWKRDPFSATNSCPQDGTSFSTPATSVPSGQQRSTFKKIILIRPNTPALTIPKGASILVSDDQWVSMELSSEDYSNCTLFLDTTVFDSNKRNKV